MNLPAAITALRRDLASDAYAWGPYQRKIVEDPKRREIWRAPFRDRVVHQAIFAILDPVFDRQMIDETYASSPFAVAGVRDGGIGRQPSVSESPIILRHRQRSWARVDSAAAPDAQGPRTLSERPSVCVPPLRVRRHRRTLRMTSRRKRMRLSPHPLAVHIERGTKASGWSSSSVSNNSTNAWRVNMNNGNTNNNNNKTNTNNATCVR